MTGFNTEGLHSTQQHSVRGIQPANSYYLFFSLRFFFFFFLHSHLQRRGQTKKQSTRTAHNLLFLSRRVKGFEKSKCLGKRIQGPQQCCRFSFHVPTPPQSLPHMHLDPFILKKSRRRTKVNCRSQNVSCKLDSLTVR